MTTLGWNHVPLIVLLGLLTMLSQHSMARVRAADTSVVLPAHYLQIFFAAAWRF